MSRSATLAATLLGTLLLSANSPAAAQSAQRWSLQGSALHVMLSGEAYEGLGSGLGFEGQVRFTPSLISVGIGYQRSVHEGEWLDGTMQDVVLAGIFVEPRYVIDIGRDNLAPYLAGRLALLSQSLDFQGITADASGTQVNLGGGLMFRLSPRMNLDVGVTYGAIGFGDVDVEFEGEQVTVPDSDSDGKNFVLRLGLTFGL